MLREPEAAAMGAFGTSEAQRFEVLFSPGIPGGIGAATLRDSSAAIVGRR